MSDQNTPIRRNAGRKETSSAKESFVDDKDLQILRVLQGQGRIANQALADAVSLSPSAVFQRVRRLEQAGYILGYVAEIDIERLTPTLFIFAEATLSSHYPEDFVRFEAEIAGIPEILAAYQISGAYDYLLHVAVQDINRWRSLADGLLGAQLGVAKIATTVKMKTAKRFGGYRLG